MSEELKKRTKKFALDVIGLCAGFPQVLETRHAIGQVIRSSSSVAANYRSACRGKSKADFISKLGTVEEEADESGFWLEMLRDIAQLRRLKIEAQASQELTRLLDEANQLSDGVVFTTIHKFMPEKGEAMPELSARQNIVVIADEAHRSQYGFGGKVNEKTGEMSYGFASNLRDALPNASFIGFTGTPIEKTDANTRAVFGDYI